MNEIESIVERCEAMYHDLHFAPVREWKDSHPGGHAIGFMPVYVPREIIHAAGMLPVGILGGGDDLEVIRGDAYFQSYICRIPRSTIELGLSGRLDDLDGMLFPSICDVIRNLSGMWQTLFEGKYVRYFDVPQNYDDGVGGEFYLGELRSLVDDLGKMAGKPVSDDALRESIALYNENRRLVRKMYAVRAEAPWKVPTSEAYLILRAGMLLPVEAHNALIEEYLAAVQTTERKTLDNARVIVTGAFCEQPPLGLIRTLERAGCAIVDDDWMLVSRWLTEEVPTTGDPIENLAQAFLHHSSSTSSRYEADRPSGAWLVDRAQSLAAEGVIFIAPSFCDPALLDRPMLERRLDEAGISHTSFKYAENSGQMQSIREQAGTFADAIKLWGEA